LSVLSHQRPVSLPLSEHETVRYRHETATLDVSVDDVLEPDYWRNVSGIARVGATIEVVALDASWVATLYVRSKMDAGGLLVGLVNHAVFDGRAFDQLAPVAAGETGTFGIKHTRGEGFSVFRFDDKSVVKDRISTRGEAEDFVVQAEEALTRPEPSADAEPGYKIGWISPKNRYGVRAPDGEILIDQCETKDAAQAWADANLAEA